MLQISPSSLFMLCGCISSSVASLMSQSTYPVFAERSFVSCSLIIWSWLMLCSATSDFSVCASCTCAVDTWLARHRLKERIHPSGCLPVTATSPPLHLHSTLGQGMATFCKDHYGCNGNYQKGQGMTA